MYFKTHLSKLRRFDIPLRHCPSSSNSLSMTKGGARAVTTLNTVLARVETAATDRSPPGQIIVSTLTFRPETRPTRFHFRAFAVCDI